MQFLCGISEWGIIMKVTIFLTEGFETVEALAVVDILRRAKIIAETVSITGKRNVTSAQLITVEADALFEEANFEDSDVLFIPGGPGHKSYLEHTELLELIKKHCLEGKRIAAICAAPSILGKLGLLEGKKAVCFPGFEESLKGADILSDRVVTDGNITTSKGMGTSLDLGLELVRLLVGQEAARSLSDSTQYGMFQ